MRLTPLALGLLVPVHVAAATRADAVLEVRIHEDGWPFSGALVRLEGPDVQRAGVSTRNGLVVFSALPPGEYLLTVTLAHDPTVERTVHLRSGRRTPVQVRVTRDSSGTRQTVVVEAPAPPSPAPGGTTTEFSSEEIDTLPAGDDVSALLARVPGVFADRADAAGAGLGQAADFVYHGAGRRQTTWLVDGVDVSDPAGGTPALFLDAESIDRIVVRGGGVNVEQPAPGLRVEVTTESGSDEHRQRLTLRASDGRWQSSHGSIGLDADDAPTTVVNDTRRVSLHASGPLRRGRAWYSAGVVEDDVDTDSFSGVRQSARVSAVNFVVHGEVRERFDWKASLRRTERHEPERGHSDRRPLETALDDVRPTLVSAVELNYAWTPRLTLTGRVSRIDQRITQDPWGAWDAPIAVETVPGVGRVWSGSYRSRESRRASNQYLVRGSFAFGRGVTHELGFGARRRDLRSEHWERWGEDQLVQCSATGGFGDDACVRGLGSLESTELWLRREGRVATELDSTNLWVGDSLRRGKWTLDVGLHYSLQDGRQLPSAVEGVDFIGGGLPDLDFDGLRPGFTWRDVLPRVGLARTFGATDSVRLSTSFATYADTLQIDEVSYGNPAGSAQLVYTWIEDDGTGRPRWGLQEAETVNVNLDDKTSPAPHDRIDPDLKAPRTREITAGVELAVGPRWTLGVDAVARVRDRTLWTPLIGVEHEDFVVAPCRRNVPCPEADGRYADTGEPYEEPVYKKTGRETPKSTDAHVLENRPGYEQRYHGLEMTVVGRWERWSLRGHLALGSWTQHFDGTEGIQDPTSTTLGTAEDGDDVTIPSTGWWGDHGDVFLGTARWKLDLDAAVALPRSWTVAAHLSAREGYGIPFFATVAVNDDNGEQRYVDVLIGGFAARRYPDLYLLDLRVGKRWEIGAARLELRGEVTNLLNSDTVVQVNRAVDTITAEGADVREVLSPRGLHLGLSIRR